MSGYLGIDTESTSWGTPSTPDTFWPVLTCETIIDPGYMRPKGIRSGRRTMVPGQLGALVVGAKITMELPNKSLAKLLGLMFGGYSGSGPLTFTPGSQVGTDKSGTLQYVIDDSTTTARPFTAYGGKIGSWELSAKVGDFAMLAADWSARDITLHRQVTDGVTTSGSAAITSATAAFTTADEGRPISGTGIPAGTKILSVTSSTAATLSANATASGTGITFTIGIAAASASYASGLAPFTFINSSISVNGSSVASAKSMKLSCNKGLADKRHVLGQRQILEQLEVDRWAIASEITADFDSNAMNILYLAATQVACVHTFSNGTESLVITTSGQVVGDPPKLSTNGLEEQTIKLDHSHATADASTITAVLTNGETTAV